MTSVSSSSGLNSKPGSLFATWMLPTLSPRWRMGAAMKAGIAHAAIDLDWLGVMHPRRDPHGQRLMFANLAAVWPIYAAAGAEQLIVARVVEDRAELDHYRAAVLGAQPTVCRLTTPLALMHKRLRIREPGMALEQALMRAAELADILEKARAEDFVVENGSGRSVGEVAREMLSLTGWL